MKAKPTQPSCPSPARMGPTLHIGHMTLVKEGEEVIATGEVLTVSSFSLRNDASGYFSTDPY